jgi:hypothetical protein
MTALTGSWQELTFHCPSAWHRHPAAAFHGPEDHLKPHLTESVVPAGTIQVKRKPSEVQRSHSKNHIVRHERNGMSAKPNPSDRQIVTTEHAQEIGCRCDKWGHPCPDCTKRRPGSAKPIPKNHTLQSVKTLINQPGGNLKWNI